MLGHNYVGHDYISPVWTGATADVDCGPKLMWTSSMAATDLDWHMSTHMSTHMSEHISTHMSAHMSAHVSTHACVHGDM